MVDTHVSNNKRKIVIGIRGMHCAACAQTIENGSQRTFLFLIERKCKSNNSCCIKIRCYGLSEAEFEHNLFIFKTTIIEQQIDKEVEETYEVVRLHGDPVFNSYEPNYEGGG